MAKQVINIGTVANDKSGDPLRTAFAKVNNNFTELYNIIETASLTELAQDYAAAMFTGGTHSGIAVTYDDANNKLNLAVDALDLSAVSQDIVPDSDNTHDLGSPTKQWRHVYTSGGSIYLDNIKLTNVNGKFTATKVINPGEENEAEDPEDSDATSEIGGGGGQGLPSITIPATPVVLYKGLQASYGVVHSNNNSNELNVNKIVIHKPATTTLTIDPTGNQDDFQVSGLGSSDVLAMFVVYGDTNGAKPLSALQNFTRAVIDNVILVDGVTGDFRTVDQMKTAFYGNYQILASAAGGLYTNFQFLANNVNTLTGGATTTREGSGAVFEITDVGNGTYQTQGTLNPGTNYREGHKIKILGTDLGGVTPDNDCIITLGATGENGSVFLWSVEGTAAGAGPDPIIYSPVSGTNIDVGSGLAIASVNNNNGTLEISAFGLGNNYVVGDVITLAGDELEGGVTPDNDMTLTVTNVGNIRGPAFGVTVSGTLPRLWPLNNVSDGGVDQYDTANYINTNLANQINYNGGNTVVDGTLAFGAGSTYSFVYDTAIFGLFVTGNGATSISTSGNSGADGGSTTETGYVFGGGVAAETFDNAVTHINLVGDPYDGEAVSFTKTDNGSEVDILIADDGAGAGVGITRDGNNGIYNPYREGSWDSDVSPGGTLWNIDGWTDLTDVESRDYVPLYEAFGFGGLGNKIVGTECVMYLPDNGKYYAVKFTQWTQGNAGGGFAYTRRELDLTSLAEGIRFADGTVLKSAAGIGPVKLESPGNRRIEEVYGYKSVSVTQRQTTNLTTTASRNATGEFRFWIDTTTTTIDDILNNTTAAGIWDTTTIEFSLDNVTWYRYDFNSTGAGNEIGYGVALSQNNLNYNQGDTIYFRYQTGGAPVVWWDRNELPGGATNFRGAIIDYHAYDTDSGTMIGTIHIARDSGDEFITHTEVFSGGTDGENIDLWLQTTEGQLKYRRLDGESSTLKVQWSAKVFYGSEYWD